MENLCSDKSAVCFLQLLRSGDFSTPLGKQIGKELQIRRQASNSSYYQQEVRLK